MNSKEDTIGLLIASYCDKELLITIESALRQADNKERIHLIICYQDDDLETLNKLRELPHCEVIHIWKKDAKGSVFARYLCQQMIKDEKYIFQIDAHSRFVKHWDTKMIEEIESLHDKKAILSSYPPGYDKKMAKLPVDDPTFDKPLPGTIMFMSGFKGFSFHLIHMASYINKKNPELIHKKNAFISENDFFTYSDAYREVLFDPNYVFYGDELPMAIRFYTHGWNVYNCQESYIYHQYVEKLRDHPFPSSSVYEEEKYFRKLLNIDGDNKELGILGLGSKRTLEDYEKTFGINFRDKIVYMSAETGDFENPEYGNKISYLGQEKYEDYLEYNKPKDIEIIIIDKNSDYQNCLNSCLNTSSKKNHLKFLIATTSKEENHDENIKKLIHIKKNTPYCKALKSLTKDIGNCYVLLIDSSVRFTYGWDNYYCQTLYYCKENSALTSWVWKTDNENHIFKYENRIKEFVKFDSYLPKLKANKEIIFKDDYPYQTGFISDNFLFCKSDIIKKIPIDSNLTYEEHQYLYSVRLWTYGINIYYPRYSYFMRTRKKNELKEGLKNKGLVDALTGIASEEAKKIVSNYPYDIGNIRPIWTWYDYLNVKYNPDKMMIYPK